jgi:hypothetical protein
MFFPFRSLTGVVPNGTIPSVVPDGTKLKENRGDSTMKFMIPLLMATLPVASVAQSQSGSASDVPSADIPKTTEVLVILTPRQGVTPQQIMAVIPDEIQATVKLYFDGKIRQWYSRGDGKGVVFMVDAKTEDEARALWRRCPSPKNT